MRLKVTDETQAAALARVLVSQGFPFDYTCESGSNVFHLPGIDDKPTDGHWFAIKDELGADEILLEYVVLP